MAARKRRLAELKMSGTDRRDRAPKTPGPKTAAQCQAAFHDICDIAGVTIAYPTLDSPADNRTTKDQCRRFFNFIYYHERADLDSIRVEITRSLQPYDNSDASIQRLHRILQDEHERLRVSSPATTPSRTQSKLRTSNKVQKTTPLIQTRLKYDIAKPHENDSGKATPNTSFGMSTRSTSFRSDSSGNNTSFAWSCAPQSTAGSAYTDSSEDDDEPFYETYEARDLPKLPSANTDRLLAEARPVDMQISSHTMESQELLDLSLDSNDVKLLDELGAIDQTQPGMETSVMTNTDLLPDNKRSLCQGSVIGADFALLRLPQSSAFCHEPLRIQWEVQRALQTQRSPACDDTLADRVYTSWRKPRTLNTLYHAISKQNLSMARGFDSNESAGRSQRTLKAKLEWTSSVMSPLFNIIMQCPNEEGSCDLQRSHGFDNVMYIEMPRLSEPPVQHKGKLLLDRFRRTFSTPLNLLGRRWILFNFQALKKPMGVQYTTNEQQSIGYKMILISAETLSASVIFESTLNYRLNATKPAQKIYARTDLFASRSTAITGLEASDIEYDVADDLATYEPDDTRFLDHRFRGRPTEIFDPKTVMNDGFGVMSAWFASEIQRQKGGDPGRCAYQARIAGAKGVWAVKRNSVQVDSRVKPPGPHLWINKSQIKVSWESLRNHQPQQLTFNLLRPNAYARTAVLHLGFLQILLDRNVPREAILRIVRQQESDKLQEVIRAIESGPEEVHYWVRNNNSILEDRARGTNQAGGFVGGFPVQSYQRMIRMLESGFDPRKNEYLANALLKNIRKVLASELSRFRIHLGRSTTLLGIPDMHNCLAPGEVYVRFNPQHEDRVTGETCQMLADEALVARNPALAPWDIQKVRCVYKPELAHLCDVIVFSTRGMAPLASKLQGGDYDGDTFWICWEPTITSAFVNHPVPLHRPKEEDLHITRLTKTLADYVQNPVEDAQWCGWACEMAINRVSVSSLGFVTNMHEKLVYKTNRVDSKEALALVYLHDYLVDADKQGYVFGSENWSTFTKAYGIDTAMPNPRYWQVTKTRSQEGNISKQDKDNPSNNIRDEIYFDTIKPMRDQHLEEIRKLLSGADCRDEQLAQFYDEVFHSQADEADSTCRHLFKDEEDHLRASLSPLLDKHRVIIGHNPEQEKRKSWAEKIESHRNFRVEYDKIQPKNLASPIIKEWLRTHGTALSTWDKLKASALQKLHYSRSQYGKLLFNAAGAELCMIKAQSHGVDEGIGPHLIIHKQYNRFKMRKINKQRQTCEYDDYDEHDFIAENIEEFTDDFDE